MRVTSRRQIAFVSNFIKFLFRIHIRSVVMHSNLFQSSVHLRNILPWIHLSRWTVLSHYLFLTVLFWVELLFALIWYCQSHHVYPYWSYILHYLVSLVDWKIIQVLQKTIFGNILWISQRVINSLFYSLFQLHELYLFF